jgi:phage-related protein
VEKIPIYYQNEKGQKPAKEFIETLNEDAKGKVLARIEFLGEHWQELKRPYVDYLGNKIYELRMQVAKNKIRIIYAFMFKNYIILLHGILKKTSKIPKGDKDIAIKRMKDFQKKYDEGKIKLN